MRIAVVTPLFPLREEPYRGHAIYRTVLELQRWAEIEAFCPLATYPRWNTINPINYRYRRADLDFSPSGVRTHYFEYPAFPFISRPVNGMVSGRHVLPHLRDFRPDLILAYWLYPDGYGALCAGRRLGVPAILGARGSDVNRIKDACTRHLTRKALSGAQLVLTVSEDLRQQAIRLGAAPERTRAIVNGCDTEYFHPADRGAARAELGVRRDGELILYLGWLGPSKGVRELMEAIIRLRGERPRVEAAFIGEGLLRDSLEARAAQSGLDGVVRFLGPKSASEVARWMAACSVFCLPSYTEGCPNAVIEALACGRPVVATNVGGIPELICESSGILVPPRDPDPLARALSEALKREWNPTAISARMNRGWDQVGRETYEACCEALSSRTQQVCAA